MGRHYNGKELFRIALTYIEKGRSYENLKDGDDLYSAGLAHKEQCLRYYDDIKEQGTNWAYKKLEEDG